ncbi:MAG: DUF5320 domain-containing protein [Candidatus Hadarchaeia archaeon]
MENPHFRKTECCCHDTQPMGKTGSKTAQWRKFANVGEKRKFLKEYRKELKKELKAVDERLEEL